MVPLALEALDALDVGHARSREVARGHHAVARAHFLSRIGRERPLVHPAVEHCRLDARIELHVAAQVEAVGDVVDVFQDLGLRAVALRPLPLLLQRVVEGVGVFEALDVAAGARIAVPEPGAADPGTGFVGAHLEAQSAQAMDGVEAGQAAAHDHDIELARHGVGGIGHGCSCLVLLCERRFR